jgi:hypothetical protein
MYWERENNDIFITLDKDDCCALTWTSFSSGEAPEDNIFDRREFLKINLS